MTDAPHEFRRDPMTGRVSVVAPGRYGITQGPDPLAGLPAPPGPCPFCPGEEARIERTLAVFPPEGPWRIRVVANRYPSVLATEGRAPAPVLDVATPATGRQEIVVESREHGADLATYDVAHATDVLRTLRDRLRVLEDDPSLAEVAVFRNKGRRAGSTQPHPHSQLIGISIASPETTLRFERARAHHAAHGETLLDAVLRRELDDGARVVREAGGFVTVTPFAPKERFETWVVPRVLRGSFADLADDALAPLAAAIGDAARRALGASGRSDYNVLFRLPPKASRADPAAFWYVEILPRAGGAAGFELVSGVPVVSVSPERAADAMRALPG